MTMPRPRPFAVPEMLICVPSRGAALLQFRRHVTNRVALAILADQRLEYDAAPPRISSDPTRPPREAPSPAARPDVYDVRVEPLAFQLTGGVCFETDALRLVVDADPRLLPNISTRLSLMAFQGRGEYAGFQTTSSEPIYFYQRDRQQFRRREGLSGDVVYLFQILLAPHFVAIEGAFA